MWGEHAEHLAKSLTAGARVVVLGRTGTHVWTPTEGERAGQAQRRLEVIADEVAPSLRWATATITKIEHRAGDAPVEDEPPIQGSHPGSRRGARDATLGRGTRRSPSHRQRCKRSH